MDIKKIHLVEHYLADKKKIIKDISLILKSKQLTNNGPIHQEFIYELSKYLDINHSNLELASNGTLALLLAAKVLGLKGKVIISPFTFPATVNFLDFINIEPIFCDISRKTLCIDEEKIEKLITKDVSGIICTNVYGNYPNFSKIEKIAKKYNLKTIYDSSHSFIQKINNTSIIKNGDASIASLHSSKLLNSIEGGLIYFKNKINVKKFKLYKNFGIKNQESILLPGINGKLNEVQASIGKNNLLDLEKEINKRKKILNLYIKYFGNHCNKIEIALYNQNYSLQYLPIIIKGSKNKKSNRDYIYELLKKNNIESRKYFYPLISNYSFNKTKLKSNIKYLKVSNEISNSILCLPFHGNLKVHEVKNISNIIINALT
jgi:dTDP-4-amino-4,6-dideoxygalactose transaminase